MARHFCVMIASIAPSSYSQFAGSWRPPPACWVVDSFEVAPMTKIKFPYTMHCPSCKVGIKVKKKEQIGKSVNCPKCGKKFEIVTPEEDGNIPYGVEAAPEPEPEPEPTEEELEEKEMERRRIKRKQNIETTKYIMSILWLLLLLAGLAGAVYYFVYVKGYANPDRKKDEEEDARRHVLPADAIPTLASVPFPGERLA